MIELFQNVGQGYKRKLKKNTLIQIDILLDQFKK